MRGMLVPEPRERRSGALCVARQESGHDLVDQERVLAVDEEVELVQSS